MYIFAVTVYGVDNQALVVDRMAPIYWPIAWMAPRIERSEPEIGPADMANSPYVSNSCVMVVQEPA